MTARRTLVRTAVVSTVAGVSLLIGGVAVADGEDHEGGCKKHCGPPTKETVTVTVTAPPTTVYEEVPTTVYEEIPTTVYEEIPTTVIVPTTITEPGGTVVVTEPGGTVTATVTQPGGATTVTETQAGSTATVTQPGQTVTEQAVATKTVAETVAVTNVQTGPVRFVDIFSTETQVQERTVTPVVNVVAGATTTSYATGEPVVVGAYEGGYDGAVDKAALAYTGTSSEVLGWLIVFGSLLIGVGVFALGLARQRATGAHRQH